MTDFDTFLRWEARSRDTIDFKKAYADMAGDVLAGLMLSQLVYWHLPGQSGALKLRVERDGHRWLAKSRHDWWEECRLGPREADRARKVLEGMGLIEVRLYKFNGSPTQHVRIRKNRFLELWQAAVEGTIRQPRRPADPRPAAELGQGGTARKPSAQANREASADKPISPIGEIHFTPTADGFPRGGEMQVTGRGEPETETTTESTINTAATEQPDARAPADLAALIEELVSHGVSRATAGRYARQKPGVCRRCLDYLPFAEVKKTPGAWLASAIRDEYGPPEGYLNAKQAEAKEAEARRAEEQRRQEARRREARLRQRDADLRAAFRALIAEGGEPLASFRAYAGEQRRRLLKTADLLSPRRREERLAAFDSPEEQLVHFAAWRQARRVPAATGRSPEDGLRGDQNGFVFR